MSTVPHSEGQSRIFIRCPASREMRQMSRIFRKLHYYFFVGDYFTFCLVTQQRDELPIKLGPYFARRQTPSIFHARQPSSLFILLTPPVGSINTATVSDVSWVVDSDWIIASILRIIRARCFPYYYYSRDMRWRSPPPPLVKMAPKRKYKSNND